MYNKENSKKLHIICDLIISISQLIIAVSLIIWVIKNG